jgi:hypothetical protein
MRVKTLLPGLLLFAIAARASLLPVLKLDPRTLRAFDEYVENYEKGPGAEFAKTGKFRIDSDLRSKRGDVDAGRIVVQIGADRNVPGGQIHHVFGTMRIPGGSVEVVHRVMQNYAAYIQIYKPDVAKSSGELLSGSDPADQHYKLALRLVQSTLWFDVSFETEYDTHYLRLAPGRSETRTHSVSIREFRNAHDLSEGLYPEGEDHGFVWRFATFWHVRDRDGGVDLELNSISLARPAPTGFGWWASRRARQAVENLMNQTRAAVLADVKSAQVSGSSAKLPAGR